MGLKNLPRHGGEPLFEIIMRRFELRSTFMTSNRPLEDWGLLIGDIPTAILDRFLSRAEIFTITGRSYRLKRGTGQGVESLPLPEGPERQGVPGDTHKEST